MELKKLLKRAGKGLVVTAASVLAGAALGPVAATAVGGFLSRAMAEIGVTVDSEVIGSAVKDIVGDAADQLMSLGTPNNIDKMADKVSEETGLPREEVVAALQYSLREFQGTLTDIVTELRSNTALLQQVVSLATESGVKIDVLLLQSQETTQKLNEVLSRLSAMEHGLDIAYRKFLGRYSAVESLDINRLRVISRLQRQRTVGTSGLGVRYTPDLYVPRTDPEIVFMRFMGDAGISDRNIFLVLGDAGLGKTWFLARMSMRCVEMGSPTFFVPLGHGIKSLTSVFHVESLQALVDLIDPILNSANDHAYIFLDGLDEMDPSNIRYLLGALAACRSDYVSFILSCRTAVWASSKAIAYGAGDLRYYIYENSRATDAAKAVGVMTPVSVLMSEFTESELKAAMQRYGIPESVPFDLLPLLSKPYILRLSAEWYRKMGSLPSPSSPEFLDLFAGGPKYADSVFRRLGILTERDSLYATVEKLIEAQCEALPLFKLPIEAESSTFATLVSSGMLRIRIGKSGTEVSLSKEFTVPLVVLTLLRYEQDRPRLHNLLKRIPAFVPDKARVIQRLVEQLIEGRTQPVEPEPTPERQPGPDVVTTSGETGTTEHEEEKKPEYRPLEQRFGPVSTGQEEVVEDRESVAEPPTPIVSESDVSAPPVPLPLGMTLTPATETLATLMNDSELNVRRSATMAIGIASLALKESERTMLLEPLIDDPDVDVAISSAWALVCTACSIKDGEIRARIARLLLADDDWGVRRAGAALAVLNVIRDRKDVTDITSELLSSDDGQIRTGAIHGLAIGSSLYGDPNQLLRIARSHLSDDHDDVRAAAVLAGGIITPLLEDPSTETEHLIELGDRVFGRMRESYPIALGFVLSRGIESKLFGKIIELLSDSEPMFRASAALGVALASLNKPRPQRFMDYVRPLLEDSDPDVRFRAALSYGIISRGVPEPIKEVQSLTDSSDEMVRAGGAIALGILSTQYRDDTQCVSLLNEMTRASDREVRQAAVKGLGCAMSRGWSEEARVAKLEPFINSEDESLRRAAAVALGVSTRGLDIHYGLALGDVMWRGAPFSYDECILYAMSSSMLLRFGA